MSAQKPSFGIEIAEALFFSACSAVGIAAYHQTDALLDKLTGKTPKPKKTAGKKPKKKGA